MNAQLPSCHACKGRECVLQLISCSVCLSVPRERLLHCRWTKKQTSSDKCKRGFCQFVYEPIRTIIDACMNDNKKLLWNMCEKLGILSKVSALTCLTCPCAAAAACLCACRDTSVACWPG